MPMIHELEYYELADYYDLMHRKYVPYEKHFSFIEGAFRKYGKTVHSILDLACGTGIHSTYFSRKGYRVTGIDLSTEMLRIARSKARAEGLNIDFIEGDIMDLRFNEEFDAAICVNQSVMACVSHSDIRGFILGVKNALKNGGIFIVDFLSEYRVGEFTNKESVDSEGVKIECIREESYDEIRQVMIDKTTYFVTVDEVTRRYEGYGEGRVFYPQEILYYLESMGNFKILGLHECWSLERKPAGPYLAVVVEKA